MSRQAMGDAARFQRFLHMATACGLIVLAVFAAFWPALKAGFVWDDVSYLLVPRQARELSWANVAWAFSWASTFAGHYQPLTWLSWMLDFELAGGAYPRQFHFTNLLLHAANGIVLLLLLELILYIRGLRYARGIALLAVLLYCLHPLRVESVAWVTERRDLLCGLFYSLSLYFWLRTRCEGGNGRFEHVAFLLFVASLLCKAWAITFPAVLWVMEAFLLTTDSMRRMWPPPTWWKQHAHYILIGVAFAIVAGLAQRTNGATVGFDEYGLSQRLMQAAYGWWWYPLKTLWPSDLMPFHTWSGVNWFSPLHVAASVGVLGIMAVLAVLRGTGARMVLGAALAYTAIVLPVLGIAQSGPQSVADRYSYIAILPWHVLAMLVAARWCTGSDIRGRAVLMCGAVLALLLGGMSFHQCSVWHDERAFWSRVIEIEPENVQARITRAFASAQAKDFPTALSDIHIVKRIRPLATAPLLAEADVLSILGHKQVALVALEQAERLDAKEPAIYLQRARIFVNQGMRGRALAELVHVNAIVPTEPSAWLHKSEIEYELGRYREAEQSIVNAYSVAPEDSAVLLQLGRVNAALGNLLAARTWTENALRLSPAEWRGEADARELLAKIAAAQ